MAAVNFASRDRFAEWWPVVESAVRGVAQRYLGASDVDDFLQDIAIACVIASADGAFADAGGLRAWAERRAKWRVFDWLRHSRHARRADAVGSSVSGPDRSPGVVEIMELIDKLPARQRDIMQMCLAGNSTEDVAKRLGIAEASVRSSLRHARACLAQWLTGE
ncbi:MAG: RNA polymerase sigma factor [Phycisphaerae bacterium]